MEDQLILFGMAITMAIALLGLNLKIRTSKTAKRISYWAMWASLSLAAWTLIRVAIEVG